MSARTPATIYFDDTCAFCRGATDFVRRRDRGRRFRYVSLTADEAAARLGPAACACETLHLVDETGVHDRSTAVLRIAAGLPAPWSWLRHLRHVPRSLRDAAYDWVARHRHRWPPGASA